LKISILSIAHQYLAPY